MTSRRQARRHTAKARKHRASEILLVVRIDDDVVAAAETAGKSSEPK